MSAAVIVKPDPDPDANLLLLCSYLAGLQKEWQRLWAACPDDGHACEAMDQHDAYAEKEWPGQGYPVKHLLDFPATTPEGLQAKAAAVLAVYQASRYTKASHDDICELMQSVLIDAAGPARLQTGDLR